MNQYLKRVTPVNWLLIAVILIVSCIAVWHMKQSDSLRDKNNALEATIQGNNTTIESNRDYIKAIDIDIKKKEYRIDSLQSLGLNSKTTVITIYRDRNENLNIIASADRDTTRLLFAGYISE